MLFFIDDPKTGKQVKVTDSVAFESEYLRQMTIAFELNKTDNRFMYLIDNKGFKFVFATQNNKERKGSWGEKVALNKMLGSKSYAWGPWHKWIDLENAIDKEQIFLLNKGVYFATKVKLGQY